MNVVSPQGEGKPSIILLLVIFVTLLVYGQVRHFTFIEYDDEIYITENHMVRKGLTFEGVRWAFTAFHAGNWHPLTWLSHMLDCELFGLNAMGHHWVNLMFHMANTLLLFIFLRKSTGAVIKSTFVAALFALHPLHVESVAWIAERKDVLSTFFFFLTLISYLWYTKQPCIGRYLPVFICLILGLMAKPMLVTLPFVLLLLDFWPLNRIKINIFPADNIGNQSSKKQLFKNLIIEKIPFFLIVAIHIIIVFKAQAAAHAVYSLEVLPVEIRLANALISYATYLFKFVWPGSLALFYPHPFKVLSLGWIALAFVFLTLISVLAVMSIKRQPYLISGWCWYLGTLVPVIGFVQVGAQSMADRYTYVPLVGIFIMVVWGIGCLVEKKPLYQTILVFTGCMVLICFSLLSYRQVSTWRNGRTVFQHAIDVTEKNWLAHNNLGRILQGSGKLQEAIEHYKSALAITPKCEQASFNLAEALHQTGKIDAAVRRYQQTLQIKSNHIGAYNNLGIISYQQGKMKEAGNYFRKMLGIDPKNASAHNNLGNIFFKQSAVSDAIKHYRAALSSDPESVNTHFMLGYLMRFYGNTSEAIRHLAKVIKLSPDNKEAYFLIGDIFLSQGKNKIARRFVQKTLQIDPLHKKARSLISSMDSKHSEIQKSADND